MYCNILLIQLFFNLSSAYVEVIGGSPVNNADDYNFVANFFFKGDQMCSGVRIHEEWILTAGHCKVDSEEDVQVVFANQSTKNTSTLESENNEIIYIIREQVPHPQFKVTNHDTFNDIMLVRIRPKDVSRTAPFNSNQIKLDDGTSSTPGMHGMLLGYGMLDSNLVRATQLQKLQLTIADFDECAQRWLQAGEYIHEWQICAGSRRRNACQGDSGGPMIKQTDNDEVVVIGLNSFNAPCGKFEVPGVYTKVSYFRDFIKETIESRFDN